MRVLTLNLRHGGGSRTDSIGAFITDCAPDTVVLTEFRENQFGRRLCSMLKEIGHEHQATSEPPKKANGVMLASRLPFLPVGSNEAVPHGAWRFLEADFESARFGCVYFPLGKAKLEFWTWFIDHLHLNRSRRYLAIGDFNTGKHLIDEDGSTFHGAAFRDTMESLDFVDAWRSTNKEKREFTWFSHAGNGFRLDYAFLSSSLAPSLISARHIHESRCPELTDHSALLVELS